ncbi:MAG: hypothetical protein K0R73_382 [Candidatus Midichloriaceae bacterium]|jgi:hypothetical protein|nr:hypothetical protein [Candidatus Midichloriaceae bacterium]
MKAAANFIYKGEESAENCEVLKDQLNLYPGVLMRTIESGNCILNLAGIAVKANKPRFLKRILAKNPEVLIVDSSVVSPLKIATCKGNLEAVKIILTALLKLRSTNFHNVVEDIADCLIIASKVQEAKFYKENEVIKILGGAYIDLCREKREVKGSKILNSLMIAACELGRICLLEAILKQFPNLAISNDFGISPLKIATRIGNVEAIRTVLSSPAFEQNKNYLISSEVLDCIQLAYKQGLDEHGRQEDYDSNNIVKKILGEAFVELNSRNPNSPPLSR